jgi:hypothetical protein
MEVCPLSRGVMWAYAVNPYPGDYGPAFAFSIVLYPPSHRWPLRAPTQREDDGLTMLRLSHTRG